MICKPIYYSKLEKYDKKAICKDCLKADHKAISMHYTNSQMMIGEYGGNYVRKIFYK